MLVLQPCRRLTNADSGRIKRDRSYISNERVLTHALKNFVSWPPVTVYSSVTNTGPATHFSGDTAPTGCGKTDGFAFTRMNFKSEFVQFGLWLFECVCVPAFFEFGVRSTWRPSSARNQSLHRRSRIDVQRQAWLLEPRQFLPGSSYQRHHAGRSGPGVVHGLS